MTAKEYGAHVWLLAAAAAVFLFARLGGGSLASWDEAIYATVAREFLLAGDWIRLTYGGALWVDKPPLAFWLTAFFYKLMGVHEFSARFFAAACGAGTVLLTFFTARRLFGAWVGYLSAWVLLSSEHFIRAARFGTLDAPLTFFITGALYCLWRGRTEERFLIFGGIFTGLGCLVKGPAALLVYGIFLLYGGWARDHRFLRSKAFYGGILWALGLGLPWHVLQWALHPAFFLENAHNHLIRRMTGVLDGHAGNYYFYIRTLINKYHPWIVPGLVAAPWVLLRSFWSGERGVRFLAVWIFLIFSVITLIQTKLAWYAVPLYPPLSMAVAWLLARFVKERFRGLVTAGFLGLMLLHIPLSHIFDHDYSPAIKQLAAPVQASTGSEGVVYLYNYHEEPALRFYGERQAAYVDDYAAFERVMAQGREAFFIIRAEELEALSDRYRQHGYRVLGEASAMRLAAVRPAKK